MNNEKTKSGLEALAGDVPLLPAKASSPAFIVKCHCYRLKPPVQDLSSNATAAG